METIKLKKMTARYGPDGSYTQTYTLGDDKVPLNENYEEDWDTVESIEANDRLGQFKVEVELKVQGTLIFIGNEFYLEKAD